MVTNPDPTIHAHGSGPGNPGFRIWILSDACGPGTHYASWILKKIIQCLQIHAGIMEWIYRQTSIFTSSLFFSIEDVLNLFFNFLSMNFPAPLLLIFFPKNRFPLFVIHEMNFFLSFEGLRLRLELLRSRFGLLN